ncbi:MAG: SpoIIE family protein phosphatase [bacterium]|nr:SpoIIE family protein phosphatase [bacterium]
MAAVSQLEAQPPLAQINDSEILYEIAGPCAFAPDDRAEHAAPDFDASNWQAVPCNKPWVLVPEFAAVAGPAWFRVHLDIPDPGALRSPALFVPLHYRGAQIFLNGRLIRETRPTDADGVTPQIPGKPELIPLPPELLTPGKNILAMRTRALSWWGGFDGSLFFGAADLLEDRWLSRMIRYSALAFVSMFVGLYFFLYYLQRRSERYNLHIALASFGLGAWILGYRGLIFYIFDNYAVYVALTFAGAILCNVFVMRFIHSFLDFRRNYFALFLEYFSYVLVAALLVEFAVTGLIAFFTQFLFLGFMSISLLIAIYLLVLCVRAALQRRPFSGRILFGFTLYTAALCYSMLDFMDISKVEPVLSEGFFAMIVVFSTVLAARFSATHRDLERAHKDLLALDRIKDDFLANTSHELRTPLNGIIGVAESLLAGAAGQPTPALSSNLSLISQSGRRLASLVDDILDFSRLKNHDLRIAPTAVDAHSAAALVVELMRPLAATKQLSLSNHIPEDAPAVRVDENRLQQILMNLVGNSVKFTEQGQVGVHARRIASSGAGELLEFEIRDTGIGIAPDDQEGIFRSFEQVSAGSDAREYGGAGLGLSISRQLVELHGGKIRVESQPGRGASFFFTLPITNEAPVELTDDSRPITGALPSPAASDGQAVSAILESASDAAGETRLADSGRRSLVAKVEEHVGDSGMNGNGQKQNGAFTILAVDDEPVNLQVLKNSLGVAGFRVLSAVNGRDALEVLEREGIPDLILLDVMMPRMSGYEVCRQLREKYSLAELPILMLTARNRIQDLVRGFEVGANDYVAKPFDQNELLTRVNTLLSLKKAVDSQMHLVTLQQELAIAKRIQLSLLPENPPEMSRLQAAMRYEPMTTVGGDFYDFHVLGDGEGAGCIVADVCGHGVPAALIASMVKLSFAVNLPAASRPVDLLAGMNRMLIDMVGTNFVTAVYAFIDPAAGRMYLANAGHLPTYIRRAKSNEVFDLTPKGMPLGCFDELGLALQTFDLEAGDRILLFTDGITEAADASEEEFGEERLKRALSAADSLDVNALADGIMAEVAQFADGEEGQGDDLTVIVIEYSGAS